MDVIRHHVMILPSDDVPGKGRGSGKSSRRRSTGLALGCVFSLTPVTPEGNQAQNLKLGLGYG